MRGRRSTWSTSVSFCVASAARGAPPERSAEVRRRLSIVGAGCFCVAGAALGASPSHFAWQVQQAEHLKRGPRSPATIEYCGRRLLVCGRRITWSTSVPFCVAGAARGAPPERSVEVRRRLSTVGAGYICVAGAALGAPQCHFAWQVQHAEHLKRGQGKSGNAPALLGAPQSHFAWQAQHLEHLSLILRGRCSTRSTSREVRGSPATIEYCGRRLRLRGRRSTWSTSVSFCVAGAARGTPQERSAEVR